MNKQPLIDCLDVIRSHIEAGNGQQALRDLNKLEHCIRQCECTGVIEDISDFPVIDLPAMLREQA